MIFGSDLLISENIVSSLFRIALILLIALVAQLITKQVIGRLLKLITIKHKTEEKGEFEQRIETIAGVFTATTGFVVWATAFFIILSELGINILPILTGAGIAGFALAFGAQNLVRDMISGLFILIENQYTDGDIIRVAGIEGKVEEVNLRRTVLRDLDGAVHHIPNGEIKTASNLTSGFSKINLDLLIEGRQDIESVKKTIEQIGKKLSEEEAYAKMISEPPHVLRVEELAKEGVVLKIVGRTKPVRRWEVVGELRKRLKAAFDEQGTTIYEKK